MKAARAILEHHGDKPREYQNRVLFLAPEASAAATLRDHVRRYLAWQSIVKDTNELNLDKHHEKEANKNLDDADDRVDASIRETYRYLLVPMQDADAEGGLGKIEWEDEALALAGSTYDKAIQNAVRDREWVILKLGAGAPRAPCSPSGSGRTTSPPCRPTRSGSTPASTSTCPVSSRAPSSSRPIESGVDPQGLVRVRRRPPRTPEDMPGLLFGSAGPVHLTDNALLIRPDAAAPKPEAAQGPNETGAGSGFGEVLFADPPAPQGIPPTKPKRPSSTPPPLRAPRRFHATVSINPADPIGSFTEIVPGRHRALHRAVWQRGDALPGHRGPAQGRFRRQDRADGEGERHHAEVQHGGVRGGLNHGTSGRPESASERVALEPEVHASDALCHPKQLTML